ncbi:hypothetical protein SLS62_002099 [Diatrype stigma]|uniref:Uncharacterized protein n=1 Tax=Diatrype stigma TaxID=117547 RepID=A0AAN9UUK4_9PEZI
MEQSTENQGLSAHEQDSSSVVITDTLGLEIAPGAPFPMSLDDTLKLMGRAQKERPGLLDKIHHLEQVVHELDNELITAKNDAMVAQFQVLQEKHFCQQKIDARLQQAEVVLLRAKSAHQELENKHRQFVERSVNQTVKLRNDWDHDLDELKSSIEEKQRLSAELVSERKRLGFETARVGKLKQDLALKTSESERWNDLNGSLQTQIDKARQEKSDNEAKATELDKRCTQLEADNAKLEARLAGSLRRTTELQATLKSKNDTTAATKEDANAKNEELEDRLSEVQRENSNLQDTLAKTRSEADTAKKESTEAEKQSRSRLSVLLSQNTELLNSLQAANERSDSLTATLNQWQMDNSNQINTTLAEVARAKDNVVAAEKKWSLKLESACRQNSELQAMLAAARSDAAVAKEEAAATERELRSRLEEASRHEMETKGEPTATREVDEEGEAAKERVARIKFLKSVKRSKNKQTAKANKRDGKKTKHPQAQTPLDEATAHLQEQLADALNETNRYKIENARLKAQQQGKEKRPRMRSMSDADLHGTFGSESKNERIAELEAKNAELEASQQGTRDADGAGSLTIYPFELRKIQTLKAELQQMTEERDEFRAKLRQQKGKQGSMQASRKAAARMDVLRKEVDVLGTKIHGAKEYIGKLSDQLATTQDKLAAVEASNTIKK